jgi:pseudaminic acid synthase
VGRVAPLEIAGRPIGAGEPCYVIAELSGNHRQELQAALDLVAAAAEAGADAVKLQLYTPDSLTIDSDMPAFRIGGGTLWDGNTLYDLYREAMTPWAWYGELAAAAADAGIACFASAFDAESVRFLVEHDAPAIKIASFELVDLELVTAAAATGKPVLLSTGMARYDEIDRAVCAARSSGRGGLGLFRCNSAYPASPTEMALATLPHMRDAFAVPVGLSDHTLDSTAATISVAFGACMIEKHLTLRRGDGGPDAAFSLEPQEFAELVRTVRDSEASIGSVRYGPSAAERSSTMFRRSLFVVEDVEAGERFTRDNVRSIRPGAGLAPRHLGRVLGSRAAARIPRGTPLSWNVVAPQPVDRADLAL